MKKIHLYEDSRQTKFALISHSIIIAIENGILKKDEQLPSITHFSKQYGYSRDTVEKAYKVLIRKGYVKALKGKGNFILGINDKRRKVLLIFNKISSYKKIIYDAFIRTLGNGFRVDLFIHHYNPNTLNEILDENLGNYHYYVIMPHFFHDADKSFYLNLLKKLPQDQLLLLDKAVPEMRHEGMGVYQDFEKDIYYALDSAKKLFEKYSEIVIVFPDHSNHPLEINDGVIKFCHENGKHFRLITNTENEILRKGTAYIAITESDLAILIKQCRDFNYTLGQNIGILSFNETVLKELLQITVVTTDFEKMGENAAHLIAENQIIQIKNPFYIIRRNSL